MLSLLVIPSFLNTSRLCACSQGHPNGAGYALRRVEISIWLVKLSFKTVCRSHDVALMAQFQPCTSSKLDHSRFLLNPDNMHKHQVYDLSMLQSYTNVYAWVLSNIMPYAQPVKYSPKPGAIVWAKLDHTSATRPNVVAAVICMH